MNKSETHLSAVNTADRQLHWLSQVMARINRTFIARQEDDSHTNLYFDPILQVLSGRWIDTPSGALRCLLDLHTMTFKWKDRSGHEPYEASVYNQSLEEIIADHGQFLQDTGTDIEGLDQPMHYQIPEYGIESIQERDLSQDGLNQWSRYRDLANIACYDMLGYLQSDSEVRIWPHHFDTAIYTEVKKALGLGFGLAIKDSMVEAPYFFLAGYGEGLAMTSKGLPGLSAGYWETGEQWEGAILPLMDFEGLSSREAIDHVRIFIREASSWYVHVSDR